MFGRSQECGYRWVDNEVLLQSLIDVGVMFWGYVLNYWQHWREKIDRVFRESPVPPASRDSYGQSVPRKVDIIA